MNFPLWIRSQVTVTAPGKLTDAEVLQRITDQLVSKGAIITSVISNSVQFHIERVLLSINPLAACRAGSVAFERVSGAIRISYELDVRYLVGWMGALAFLSVPLILAALFAALLRRSYALLIFFLVACSIIAPVNYLFYYLRVKSLFRQAVLQS